MSNSNKILTVSIAAYNVSQYLEDALLPFIKSKYKDELEVLIIDDGSKDNTAEIATKYQVEYPNTFRLISKENGGWGSTLNSGIKEGTGKYFKQLDGDDYFSYENLDNFIEYLKENDADLIHSPFMTFTDKNGAILRLLSSGWDIPWRKTILMSEIPTFCPAMHTVTVKLDILKKNNVIITEKCFYTDVEFVLKMIGFCHSFSYYELPIYYYRLARNGQSMSIEGVRKNWKDHLKMLFTMLEYEKEYVTSNNTKQVFKERLHWVCEWQYIFFFALLPSEENRNALIEFDKKLKKEYPDYYYSINNNAVKILRRVNFFGSNFIGKIQTLRDKKRKLNIFEGN
ncbi:glycosyltransferase family 2 protein [Actinobacillus genomosp. 1]|uniref:glycosyltransferase family 2 protein n=1 Tax=Actinobacillus genomosp. 1 TaxID=254839 RepID=UPI002441EFBE|nr:glycosyltransferase family 2 protein [Actinobacillus genomosp. 1]WGE35426.1 glycosyltransferase family 2 protein [Actinobacillus genomosp. 1]